MAETVVALFITLEWLRLGHHDEVYISDHVQNHKAPRAVPTSQKIARLPFMIFGIPLNPTSCEFIDYVVRKLET